MHYIRRKEELSFVLVAVDVFVIPQQRGVSTLKEMNYTKHQLIVCRQHQPIIYNQIIFRTTEQIERIIVFNLILSMINI